MLRYQLLRKRIGTDPSLLRAPRLSRGDDTTGETGETTRKHHCESGSPGRLKEHMPLACQKSKFRLTKQRGRGEDRAIPDQRPDDLRGRWLALFSARLRWAC